MEEKIKEIFANILEISTNKINDDTQREDIENWDSLRHIILVAVFEEEFKISIEPEEIVEMYEDYYTFKNIIMRKVNSVSEQNVT